MESVGIVGRNIDQDRKAKKTFLFCVISALIIGVLCHVPAVTGYLFPVTSVNIAGRCISALLFLLGMALSVATICFVFEIKGKWKILLTSFLIMSSPWITLNISDYNRGEIKAFAFLLAALSAYVVLYKEKKGHKFIALGIGIVGTMLGMGNVFINVFLTIIVLQMIYRLVTKEERKEKIFSDIRWELAILLVICVASLIMGLSRGQGIAFLSNVKNSLGIFVAYYFKQNFLNNAWRKRKLVHMVLFLLLGILIFFGVLMKKVSWRRRVAVVIGLVICPVAMCGFQIFSPVEHVSIRTLPAMNLIYVLLLAIVSVHILPRRMDFPVVWCTWLGLGYIAYILVLYGQIYQSTLQINHVKLYALANRITAQIAGVDDAENLPVLIYGNMRYGNYPDQYAQELAGYILAGAMKPDLFSDDPQIAAEEWIDYLCQYCEVQYMAPTAERFLDIVQKEEFAQMSYFPEEGAVRIIDDTVVVKLSD